MTFSAFCADYLLLSWWLVGGMFALIGAVSVWAWMHRKMRQFQEEHKDGIAAARQFRFGAFKND